MQFLNHAQTKLALQQLQNLEQSIEMEISSQRIHLFFVVATHTKELEGILQSPMAVR